MEKKPKFVAFATQKGGVGKTTFTVLTASYFHFVLGYNVAIVDCDAPQHNSNLMRTRDLAKLRSDKRYQKLVMAQQSALNGKRAYPVIKSSVEDGIASAMDMMEKTGIEYDLIFFDLPGTIGTSGVLKIISEMDYIFSPIKADRNVLETSLAFALTLDNLFLSAQKGALKGFYPFWNEVKKSSKSILFSLYNEILKDYKIHCLNTMIPHSVKFSWEISDDHREIFRSTFFPVDKKSLKTTHLDELFEEIRSILNL